MSARTRAIAYGGVFLLLLAALQYGHTADRSGVAVVAAVVVAVAVLELAVRSGHRG